MSDFKGFIKISVCVKPAQRSRITSFFINVLFQTFKVYSSLPAITYIC